MCERKWDRERGEWARESQRHRERVNHDSKSATLIIIAQHCPYLPDYRAASYRYHTDQPVGYPVSCCWNLGISELLKYEIHILWHRISKQTLNTFVMMTLLNMSLYDLKLPYILAYKTHLLLGPITPLEMNLCTRCTKISNIYSKPKKLIFITLHWTSVHVIIHVVTFIRVSVGFVMLFSPQYIIFHAI